MRSIRLFHAFLALLLSTVSAFSQDTVFPDESIACREALSHQRLIEKRLSSNPASDLTDMIYQEMHWDIDPAIAFIRGRITYVFISRTDDLSQLVLDLATAMQVDSVLAHGASLTFVHDDSQLLTIELFTPVEKHKRDTITIYYHGIPASTGLGSFILAHHGNNPIIYTESAAYGARDFWPAKQDLDDKIDSIDLFITTPPNIYAAGPGLLDSIIKEDDHWTHHWKHRYPIANYLIGTAITNYAVYSDFLPLENGDSLEVLNYVYPENLNEAKTQTPKVLDVIQFYSSLFGPYPFEKYGHAQWADGGGTELQTMSSVSNFEYPLLAHELAHMWFGDKVTCHSWQDVWLNEGFATYLTGLTYEHFPVFGSWNYWKTSTRASATSEPDGSVFVTDTSDVFRIFDGRLTYDKGAFVLHMLRWVVGDSAFFKACRQYLEAPGIAYAFGSTDDLKSQMEQASGLDLSEFFRDWYYGQGYPSYTINWMERGDSVVFHVHQETSDPSVDFFEMPLPVALTYPGGIKIFVLNNTAQDQVFTFEHGLAHISNVILDPDKWILSKNNTVHEIITGLDQSQTSYRFTLFPNPANQKLQITGPEEVTTLIFTGMDGIVREVQITNQYCNTAFLPPEVYIVTGLDHTGHNLFRQKVMISH